jgi:hypothetical protein
MTPKEKQISVIPYASGISSFIPDQYQYAAPKVKKPEEGLRKIEKLEFKEKSFMSPSSSPSANLYFPKGMSSSQYSRGTNREPFDKYDSIIEDINEKLKQSRT